ncbi:MAG TPA: sulfatase, partial [Planctomycetota bacterium]|nr:sulfatase [Planctomycetota bacterium]
IDSLRLDHTAFAAHPASARELTPNLARLAARGTVFQNAIAQAPWTMPSFASVFTGKYPHEHGAVSAKGFLREREMTLAEVLREAGYATAGIVSHDYVNGSHGFAQGCEEFDAECVRGESAITSSGVSDRAIERLKRKDERPFFLFLHYFDPHYEYRDHEESKFADGYDGWLRSELNIENVRLKQHWLGAAEKQWLVDLYDEEIVHTDRQIGRVLDQLEQSGLAEDTLIVFVVDHGEEFFEHGWIGHCITMCEEVLHVPLVIALPGKSGVARKVAGVVETRSVFSTVLDAVGCAWGEASRPESLLSLLKDESATAPADALGKLAFSSVWTPDSKPAIGQQARMFSVRSAKWKLIWDQTRSTQSLFDLEHDPGEQREVSAEHPAEFTALKAALEPWVERMQASLGRVQYIKLDPAERARLEALGYL